MYLKLLVAITAAVVPLILISVLNKKRKTITASVNSVKDNFRSTAQCFTLSPNKFSCFAHGKRAVCGKNCTYALINCIVSKIGSCRTRIDVCLCHFTLNEVYVALLRAHKRGVPIRCVGDKVMLKASGSRFFSLRDYGIPVKVQPSSHGLMHHKFLIVGDDVIFGSLNFTKQGFGNNFELVVITPDPAVNERYSSEFSMMWEQFEEAC